ncbi:aprataxin-like protein [Topomyia yanbarensis]|uniref:aprataxin-like protein n=1 Tax=Topomyia yanbarensis TaxID=2498891 RepID=UPI00273C54C2|nr:aprataxin-like protein [Topomyia yanbarensis]XP_058811813.1 aprataxin-like protein [Topomyia yanbarensis]XP_058811814.1 aprataxin-like protein [Topomyia yanbarensis]XP_058811815.1 aprataxin-like protein [Topomyia yanbarensis]XP_058811816.1 aprataxin-like protein [Topomyia yanbarensis]XP_058811817.1 aprataxin-like protein [Topomyia yanbarensis]XP_058811818.1 aprataxin-like protein [Topomyia yanbarensis]
MANWSGNLIKDMQDSSKVILRSSLAAVLRDRYPKARHHFLVLPWEDINTVYQLKSEHLGLLEDMHKLALQTIEFHHAKLQDFKMGFHMRPSMNRLHLHVISTDFVSDSLKRERHWTHFNTAFCMPFQSIVDELKRNGKIEPRSEQYIESLLNGPLICNQCSFQTHTIAFLKRHLQEHLYSTTRYNAA